MPENKELKTKAVVVAVDMGYGHQRTAFPLKRLAINSEIVNANNYPGIPQKDKNFWQLARRFYEAISKFKKLPLLGGLVFHIYNKLQAIPRFFPRRDLSRPPLSSRITFRLIKNGWGRHLIEKLAGAGAGARNASRSDAGGPPLISAFFIPAFMAEYFNYPGEIFCVICDTDISRAWTSLRPGKSRIKYFAPNIRTQERLGLYGVRPENIFLTGYPLPLENIGGESMDILKNDLKSRLLNLDPQGRYRQTYGQLIKEHLGDLPSESGRPLTIMFSVGGAGAQKDIAVRALVSLKNKIQSGEIKMILAAGVKDSVKDFFVKNIKRLGLGENLNAPHESGASLSMQEKNIEIIFSSNIEHYFSRFNRALRTTDILWTKPSELSFYAALGLPIIVAPAIGSQEDFNKRWLLKSGFGMEQENPKYSAEWLFDWLDNGYLAECAMQGFIEGEKLGVLNIQKIITDTENSYWKIENGNRN